MLRGRPPRNRLEGAVILRLKTHELEEICAALNDGPTRDRMLAFYARTSKMAERENSCTCCDAQAARRERMRQRGLIA